MESNMEELAHIKGNGTKEPIRELMTKSRPLTGGAPSYSPRSSANPTR